VLIFLDLETTGLEADDKICSISVLYDAEYQYALINEGKKIPPQASAIHHLTNEDIVGKEAFSESAIFAFLELHNSLENTLVAHNVQFDLEKLASHGLIWKGAIIDTLKVTKHLIPECELFSLQFLRYELLLYRQEVEIKERYGIKDALLAHNALGDAVVLKLLFEYLEDFSSVEMMQELSFKNVLLEKFSFGKYKGRYIEEICFNDRSYVEWMLGSDIDEDMKYSINHYLQG